MATLLAALGLALVAATGWAGAVWVVRSVPPSNPVAMSAFYLFVFAGLATTAALFAWLAARPRHPRPDSRLATPLAFLGHGMLLATISLFGLWLQSLRMLSVTVLLLLAGLYVFLELGLLFGTRGSGDGRRSATASPP